MAGAKSLGFVGCSARPFCADCPKLAGLRSPTAESSLRLALLAAWHARGLGGGDVRLHRDSSWL